MIDLIVKFQACRLIVNVRRLGAAETSASDRPDLTLISELDSAWDCRSYLS